MEAMIGIVAWPAVALIVALVGIFAFKSQLAELIGRTKRIGKGGLEAFETQPTQPREEKKGVDDFFREFDNPLLLEAEQSILQDLKARHIEAQQDREKALIRALASSNLILHFERVHGAIWASQVSLLRFLNSRDDGANASDLVPFYEKAKASYATWYEHYPFERWLGFLQSFNLVQRVDSRFRITVEGREFLKYLVATGKTEPYYG